MQCYRDYLAVQAEEERKKEKELDALVNEEVQKQWAKRVKQWRMEREARKKLLQDVLDTRKKQIQERREYLSTNPVLICKPRYVGSDFLVNGKYLK